MTVLLLARFTLREAIRKRVIVLGVLLTLAFLGLYTVGAFLAFRDADRLTRGGISLRQIIAPALLWMGLYAVNLIGGLLAILTAVGAISSEMEQGTLTAIVVKPLRRWEIIVGKWLGYGAMLATYVMVTGAAVVLIVRVVGQHSPPNVLQSLGLLALEALLLLALTLAGSTLFAAMTNGIVLLILYTCAVVGGMVEQIGSLIQSSTMVNIGIVTSLLVPSDVLWKLSTYLIQANQAGNTAILGPFAVLSPPSNAMVAYAALYMVALLGVASWIFEQKDL